MGIVETTAARLAAPDAVETVYRQDGDRLWRALYAFAGDADLASDAVAEAFA
jgi:DNA-directed RNA polymerase specialized sigma24 family protein